VALSWLAIALAIWLTLFLQVTTRPLSRADCTAGKQAHEHADDGDNDEKLYEGEARAVATLRYSFHPPPQSMRGEYK